MKMKNLTLLAFLFSSIPHFAHAQLPESECYKLQSEAYKNAEDEKSNPKRQLDLSMKLTEECGYLMSEEVLKQRRAYNYELYKALNNKQ